MFIVHEMMGNFSKEVAMFSTNDEASEYIENRWLETDDAKEYADEVYETLQEDFMSYFSIENDMREAIDEDDLTTMYDDMLDECYPEMFNMCASIILYRADPIQYNCGLSDFYNSISDQYYCEEME